MIWQKTFVRLDPTIHDRDSFDCGELALNEFISKQASRLLKAGLGTTMVLPALTMMENGKYPICAFYTVAPSSIERKTLPEAFRKKLPCYPVPVFLLAQLAVDLKCKGKGLGKISLVRSLQLLSEINRQISAYAVIVDCLNDSAQAFYKKYGFQEMGVIDGRMRLFLEMDTINSLRI